MMLKSLRVRPRRSRVTVGTAGLPQRSEGEVDTGFQPARSPADQGEPRLDHQTRLALVSSLVMAASGDRTPREQVTAILQLLVEALEMNAAAFLAIRDTGNAEVVGAYGRTRRRGYPYPSVDCSDPSVAPLLRGLPLIEYPGGVANLPTGLVDTASPRAAQVVLVAARAAGEVSGLLQLSRRTHEPLDGTVQETLLTAGRILAMITQRQALFTESERSAAILETAYTVSRAISRSLDLEDTFKVIAVNAARFVRGTRCLLFELDASSGDLVAVASSEEDDERILGLRLRCDGEGITPCLSASHLQLAVEELVWGAGMGPELRDALAMRTALFLPMLAQNEFIGTLALFSPSRARPFQEADIAVVEEVAEQAAVAIHNARLYRDLARSQQSVEALVRRLTRVREHARRSLAAIVHDDILQSVVGAVYKLEAAVDDLPAAARPPLEETIAVLRSAVDEARRVISDLRPPALEGLGLAAALRTLADRGDTLGPAKVGVDIDGRLEPEKAVATALYKIAREAMTNAQRHAHAQHIWLSLAKAEVKGEPCACLTVRDDGRGFALTGRLGRGAEDHYGLSMMEEQASFAGGSLHLSAGPGEGTIVEALVPLCDPRETRGTGGVI